MRHSELAIAGDRIPARIADSWLEQARGHMFRRSGPDYALVFPSDEVHRHLFHMLFVPFALDAIYVADGEVQSISQMQPWTGWSTGRADTVIEVAAGEVDVSVGDEVALI